MSTKVLVFEHDAGFATELRRELSRLGCNVTLVDDGNAGLQQAAADRPDLILLSIELPRMNGFSVCNKLKKDPSLKDVPLVIMSSESSEETFEQHKKLRTRAEDYVHKPIAFGELLQHMRALLPHLGEGGSDDQEIAIDDDIVVADLEDDEMTQVGQIPPGVREQLMQRGQKIIPRKVEADSEVDAFADQAFDNLLGGQPSTGPRTNAAPAPTHTQSAAPRAKSVLPAERAPSNGVADAEIARLRDQLEREEHSASAAKAQVREREEVISRLHKDLESADAARRAAETEADNARDEIARVATSNTDGNTVLQQELERLREELKAAREAQIEVERLRRELEAASSAPKGDPTATVRVNELEEENQRLSREITDLRARASKTPSIAPTMAGRPSGVSTRDFLELRESLNKKDKELLALKDQTVTFEKQLIDARDKLFAQERISVELEEKYDLIAKQLSDSQTQEKALRADKDQAQKRGDDFSKRFERARLDGENFQKEVAAAREQHAAAITELHAARDRKEQEALAALRSELESAKSDALAGAERAHAEEAARLRAEHERALADSHDRNQRDLAEAQQASTEAREAAVEKRERELREELETKLATLASEHANKLEALTREQAIKLEALTREQATKLEALTTEQTRALDAAARAADDRIAEATRERDTAMARAGADAESRLAAAVAERDATLAERDATLAERDAQLAAAIADREAKVAELSADRDQRVAAAEHSVVEVRSEAERAINEARAEADRSLAEATRAFETKHATTLAELTALRDRERDDLVAQVAGARANLERLSQDLEAERQRVGLLSDEVNSRSTAVEGLSTQLGDAVGRISTLESDLNDTRAKLDEESSRARRALEKFERDRMSLERAKDALAEALTRIEEAETQVA